MEDHVRRHFWELIGVILTLLCLWLTLSGIRLSEVLEVLVAVDWRLLLVAVVLDALIYAATALRWRLLFHPYDTPALPQLLVSLLLAQLANTVFPAKLGPVVRAMYIGEVERVSKVFVLATVFGEKVWEGLTLLLVFALVAPLTPVPSWLDKPALFAGGASVALFVTLWFVAGKKQYVHQFLENIAIQYSWLVRPAVHKSAKTLLKSLDVWRLLGINLQIAGWSLIIWGITAGLNYVALQALAIKIPAVAALLLVVVLQVGARVPSSPGNIGVFHYLTVLSLGIYGITPSVALSYAIVLHGLIFLLPSVAGALALIKIPMAGRAIYHAGFANTSTKPIC